MASAKVSKSKIVEKQVSSSAQNSPEKARDFFDKLVSGVHFDSPSAKLASHSLNATPAKHPDEQPPKRQKTLDYAAVHNAAVRNAASAAKAAYVDTDASAKAEAAEYEEQLAALNSLKAKVEAKRLANEEKQADLLAKANALGVARTGAYHAFRDIVRDWPDIPDKKDLAKAHMELVFLQTLF